MQITTTQQNGVSIALVLSDEPIVTSGQSALDLIATVRYETGCDRMAINKEALAEGFFKLSTGLAGEVLQKFINYRMKLAVYGDYSRYTSKPLRDFLGESNRGRDVFFVASQAEAVERLAQVPLTAVR